LIVAGVAIGAVIVGSAVADSGTPPAAGYVSVSPATKVFGGSIGAGKSVAAIAIGGATTVPTNATAVQMKLAIKSTAAGALVVFPTGDPTAPGSQNVSYGSGTTNVTINETVGTKDEITFRNAGSASATVTVSDSGYSTQLTAANIAPDGGNPGDILTNTGSGTAWETGGLPSFNSFDGFEEKMSPTFLTTLASLSLPTPGYYNISLTTNVVSGNFGDPSQVLCYLVSPFGNGMDYRYSEQPVGDQDSSIALQGVIYNFYGGGTVTLQCYQISGDSSHPAGVYNTWIVATQVHSANGFVYGSHRPAAPLSLHPPH
jgi:hypothetical protein